MGGFRGSYCRRSGTTSVADGMTRPPVAGVAQPPRFVERVLELDDGAVTCWGRNHPRWGSRIAARWVSIAYNWLRYFDPDGGSWSALPQVCAGRGGHHPQLPPESESGSGGDHWSALRLLLVRRRQQSPLSRIARPVWVAKQWGSPTRVSPPTCLRTSLNPLAEWTVPSGLPPYRDARWPRSAVGGMEVPSTTAWKRSCAPVRGLERLPTQTRSPPSSADRV